MRLQELKLAIIQAITQCDDPALLKTIQQMLTSLAKPADTSAVSSTDQQAMLNVLLRGDNTPEQDTGATSAADIQDLQDSIDEVFGK